jgi:hypothetical protein
MTFAEVFRFTKVKIIITIVLMIILLSMPVIPMQSALAVVGAGVSYERLGVIAVGSLIDFFENPNFTDIAVGLVILFIATAISYILSCLIVALFSKIKSKN